MKIFVIGKKNFLHWGNHVVDAFNVLGHEVEHFQINDRPFGIQFTRGILKVLLGKKRGNKISNNMFISNLKNKLESFKPDFIFFTSACFIPVEFYKAVNELSFKPKIFAWEGDGGANDENSQKLVPYIDILFETDITYVKENKHNFKEIKFLPFCANINLYKDLNNSRVNKSYFCGSWSIDRDEIFSKLTDFKIAFRGWNWDKLSKKSFSFDIKLGTVTPKQQVEDYNNYIAAINKHQAINHVCALNMRTFEVPACKTLLINDYRNGIEELFDINNEIVVYRNIDELKAILVNLQNNPESFSNIIENGYKRVLSEHTYIHRMQKVIDIFKELN